MRPNRVTIVTGRRRPHEQAFSVAGVALGVFYLYQPGRRPRAVEQLLVDERLVAVWAIVMLLGGVAALLGCYWPGDALDPALYGEQGGQLLQAGAALVWAAGALVVGGAAAVGGLVFGTWSAACLWRALQIHRDIRQMRGAARP